MKQNYYCTCTENCHAINAHVPVIHKEYFLSAITNDNKHLLFFANYCIKELLLLKCLFKTWLRDTATRFCWYHQIFTGSTQFLLYWKVQLKIAFSSRAITVQKSWFYLTDESHLKMMNNPFYCILKALFVLEIFTFLSWPFWLYRQTTW